ncbi:MAG: hypothetical protein GYB24_14165 [Rhodobacteraceae bacterium]|nr:hypothetical protein [Paracoccaceae bacterium]
MDLQKPASFRFEDTFRERHFVDDVAGCDLDTTSEWHRLPDVGAKTDIAWPWGFVILLMVGIERVAQEVIALSLDPDHIAVVGRLDQEAVRPAVSGLRADMDLTNETVFDITRAEQDFTVFSQHELANDLVSVVRAVLNL